MALGASLARGAGVEAVSFVAAGDFGSGDAAARTLTAMAAARPAFALALGDLGYGKPGSEPAWCALVKRSFGEAIPFQLVAGNHDDPTAGTTPLADIVAYAACLPDRMRSRGVYGVQYSFDVGRLLRVIAVSPDLFLGRARRTYALGTPEAAWLTKRIAGARKLGIRWVVVAMHKPCLTVGLHRCEAGAAILDLLLRNRVDLVVSGHNHDYERFRQLALSARCPRVEPDAQTVAACVAGRGRSYRRGAGTAFVVAGTGGAQLYPVNPLDADRGYLARALLVHGYLRVTATRDRLDVRFVDTGGRVDDRFEIR